MHPFIKRVRFTPTPAKPPALTVEQLIENAPNARLLESLVHVCQDKLDGYPLALTRHSMLLADRRAYWDRMRTRAIQRHNEEVTRCK